MPLGHPGACGCAVCRRRRAELESDPRAREIEASHAETPDSAGPADPDPTAGGGAPAPRERVRVEHVHHYEKPKPGRDGKDGDSGKPGRDGKPGGKHRARREKPRRPRRRHSFLRFIATGVVLVWLLNSFYPDLDVPLVPGIACGPDTGAGVVPASYDGQPVGVLDDGLAALLGQPLRDLLGEKAKQPVRAALGDILRLAVGVPLHAAGETFRAAAAAPPRPEDVRAALVKDAGQVGAVVGFVVDAFGGDVSWAGQGSADATNTSSGGCAPCPVGVPVGKDGVGVAAAAAAAAGWTGADLVTAVAVAGAESGWRHDAANPGSTARGMWQTMMSYHQPKYAGASWRDPYANARVAHQIWRDAGGWSPWVVYTSGAYLSRMDAARSAVQSVTSGGTVPAVAVSDGPVTVDGKRVSAVAAKQLALAEAASGIDFRVMQGGYGGDDVAASGTSHDYPGVVDVSPATIAGERVLREYGFAAWARNIPGRSSVGSGAHIHAVSLLDQGTSRSPQVYGSWPKDGNGLSGSGNDPAPHYPWVPGLAGMVGGTVVASAQGCGGGTREAGGVVGGDGIGGGAYTAASFNVLGSNHTGGDGARRMPGVLRLLGKHGVDVVGFQELQRPQWAAFKRYAGGFGIWAPSTRHTDNAVAWRLSKFRFVRGTSISVPYFNGRRQQQPVVLLESRTDPGRRVWVGSFHNPAETKRFHQQGRWREAATGAQIALARRVDRSGVPLLITGDMNERNSYRDQLSGSTGMHTLGDGGIDWVFGSREVRFVGHTRDDTPRRAGVSDHPIVVAEVAWQGLRKAS